MVHSRRAAALQVVKRRKAEVEEEGRLQEAVAAITKAGIRQTPQNTYYCLSVTGIAAQYGVDHQKLRRRLKGVLDKRKSHEMMMKLSPSQESVLVNWVKVLGERAIPWTPQLLREKASLISGCKVGDKWVSRCMVRHPSLKTCLTVGLESNRAQALNRTTTTEFFRTLQAVVDQYDIKPENLYNMDEKGVQMGIGGRARVIVDRNQKTVYMKTGGNRELVTLVECVCADGSALSPLAIFKGMRTNPRWASRNIINASIASSPNGWTDAELGSIWIEQVFEPQTRNKLTDQSNYRLLILDGHCSHCTLKFLALAERHKVIILCLPPHTTHALQPCDVGVFGPLATRYKKEVTKLSKLNIAIRKENLLHVYGRARIASFSRATIKSAFRKTGIYPLDPDAIPKKLFAPALTTTTAAAQPIPAALPSFINTTPIYGVGSSSEPLVPAPLSNPQETHLHEQFPTSPDTMDLDDNEFRYTPKFTLTLPEMPSVLPPKAPHNVLLTHITLLRKLLDKACMQISADYAHKILMDQENGQLRTQLFLKSKDKETRSLTSSARILTHQESQILMHVSEYAERMKFIHEELRKAVTTRAKSIAEKEKKTLQAEQQAAVLTRHNQRTFERQQKEAEKEARVVSREEERRHREAEREAEKAKKEAEREIEKARKNSKREKERMRKVDEKERKGRERAELKGQQELARVTRTGHQKKAPKLTKTTSNAILSFNKENTHLGALEPLDTPDTLAVSSMTTELCPNHSPQSSQQHLDLEDSCSPRAMPRAVFNLHNIDPELLKM